MMSGVLILSARVGAGHIRAAQAIQKAFAESGATESVHCVDALDYANPLFRRLYTKAYIDMVNTMPALYGFYYDEREKRAKHELLRPAFSRLNTRPLIKLLEEHQPDITVCTHFMPAEIISWLVREKKLATRQAIVVTDFDIHVQWLCPSPAHYFVAIDEARAHLESLGVPPTAITVSGIPIDPVFSQPKESGAMRDKHGLRRDAIVILISAGGFGIGQVDEVLASLLQLRHPAEIVTVCGQNEELKARVDRLAAMFRRRLG